MSIAKKAVDSTLKRILKYTAEIIASIFLLILISLPLAFVVPMWIQRVVLGTPANELFVNPAAWFGSAMYVLIVVGLGAVSFIFGYPFLLKLIPGTHQEKSVAGEADEEEPESSADAGNEPQDNSESLADDESVADAEAETEE